MSKEKNKLFILLPNKKNKQLINYIQVNEISLKPKKPRKYHICEVPFVIPVGIEPTAL